MKQVIILAVAAAMVAAVVVVVMTLVVGHPVPVTQLPSTSSLHKVIHYLPLKLQLRLVLAERIKAKLRKEQEG